MAEIVELLQTPVYWIGTFVSGAVLALAAKALRVLGRTGGRLGTRLAAVIREKKQGALMLKAKVEDDPHLEVMLAFDEQRRFRAVMVFFAGAVFFTAVGFSTSGVFRITAFALAAVELMWVVGDVGRQLLSNALLQRLLEEKLADPPPASPSPPADEATTLNEDP